MLSINEIVSLLAIYLLILNKDRIKSKWDEDEKDLSCKDLKSKKKNTDQL